MGADRKLKTVKRREVTVSIRQDIVTFADTLAKAGNISRSEVLEVLAWLGVQALKREDEK
jgi:hypothetical protein